MKMFRALFYALIAGCLLAPMSFGQNVARATFISASGTAFTAGDVVGAAATLAGVRKPTKESATAIAVLDSIFITDEANQKAALTIKFFQGAAPTVTDNAAFTYGASDFDNEIWSFDVTAADYVTQNGKATVSQSLLAIIMGADTGRDVYVVVITNGSRRMGRGRSCGLILGFGR